MHTIAGALLGILILHPVTMAIYWFEFHPSVDGPDSVWHFIGVRMLRAFALPMLPMTATFALLGGLIGLGFGRYYEALSRRNRTISRLSEELGRDLSSLIRKGESELVEFKTSARWDLKKGAGNKTLEDSVVRTIAGFMNHRGGTLLLGVSDEGSILGLDKDYETLRRKDRDGFERFLMGIVHKRLGGDVSALVHPVFHDLEDKEVCRIIVEPCHRPVYMRQGDRVSYYVRMGNGTRALDVEEAVKHISERWRVSTVR